MLSNTNWSHFLTDFSFAIDISPEEIKFNQNDLNGYIADLTDKIVKQLERAASFSNLITFTVQNHLLIKIDTIKDVVNDQFFNIVISLIPFFILNLFLGFVIQKKIIDPSTEVNRFKCIFLCLFEKTF